MDSFPGKFSAGLTFDVLRTVTECPAITGWALSALLRGPSNIDIAATAEGNQHRFTADAATTAAWQPGLYRYVVRASLDGQVVQVDSGQIEILPDMAALSPGSEIRTHAAIVLANIEAVLEKRATQDQARYTINNRELWRTPIADLLLLRATYQGIVQQETRVARGGSAYGRSVYIRFKNPR